MPLRSRLLARALAATLLVVAATPLVGVSASTSASQRAARLAAPSATPAGPLVTAIDDAPAAADHNGATAFGEHVRVAGAGIVRVGVRWANVAPTGTTKPVGFEARNPSDLRYAWSSLDQTVDSAVQNGLTPLLFVLTAPTWAQNGRKQRPNDGPVRPSAAEFASFMTALATRYGGGFDGLPRVRYWQLWNEPNLSVYLMPQVENGNAVSPEWYRGMVNAAARAVHAVRPDNVVVAGGLAPFGGDSNDPSGGAVPDQERIRPLQFMRELLCMSKGAKPRPTCNARTELDVWAHHPYTYGGPTHEASHPDDVSIGDLGDMRKLLVAAQAAGHVQSRRKVAFWVTEFSYDSQPADPKGLPQALHARWVSESLYRMWQSGVSLVTWFRLRDDPFPKEMFQSGLYLRGKSGIASDKPKLALRAFRFPFVAFRQKGAVSYWGRTPTSSRSAVVVEQKQGARWRRLVAPRVNRYGIFQGRIARVGTGGALRARLANGSDLSQPFSLTVPKDFRFCPWGSFC